MPQKFITSLRDALHGIKCAFREEQSFRIQTVTALAVTFLMFYFPLSHIERAVLFLTIFMVLSLEIVNSIFEKTMDIIRPEINSEVGKAKDMMAAAVLTISIGAAIVGLIIFLPYFLS